MENLGRHMILISSALLILTSFIYEPETKALSQTIVIKDETNNISYPVKLINISIQDIQEPETIIVKHNCSYYNYSVPDLVSCEVDKTSEWYNYNISNINKDLTVEQLKKSGGVCWQYANYYVKLFASYNFTGTTYNFPIGKINHMVALVKKDNFYCWIDQLDYHCVELDLVKTYALAKENNITIKYE